MDQASKVKSIYTGTNMYLCIFEPMTLESDLGRISSDFLNLCKSIILCRTYSSEFSIVLSFGLMSAVKQILFLCWQR